MADSIRVIPRAVPEGIVPLIAVEGTAYDCGREYAETVLRKYPTFREYVDYAWGWRDLPPLERRLLEERAPHLFDVHRGIMDVAGPPASAKKPAASGGCTSFALHRSVTLDGHAITGQTKDTPLNRVERYIILRMRIKDAPTILTLAYPGETMGYGMWSTGMSLYRNTLYSSAGLDSGLSGGTFGFLALAAHKIDEVKELANKYGRRGAGNFLIADGEGNSVAVEGNAGGMALVEGENGINTHANNPLVPATKAFEHYDHADLKADSEYRTYGLRKLLAAERGRLTAQKVLQILADHTKYPLGTCKHESMCGDVTTAAVITEPTRGKLHVVRGAPCSNWPVTYTL